MSEPIRRELKHPLTLTLRGPEGERQEILSEVTFRRIKAKDLRATDDFAGDVAKSIALLSKSTGLPVAQIDELDVEDFVALSEVLEDFLPPGLRTGPTPLAT